jgi:hypothetical protein
VPVRPEGAALAAIRWFETIASQSLTMSGKKTARPEPHVVRVEGNEAGVCPEHRRGIGTNGSREIIKIGYTKWVSASSNRKKK